MTQNAEQNLRTRDAQITALATMLMALAACKPANGDPNLAMESAKNHVLEAEARGAAEQRRKDAESDRPSAYRWTYGIGEKWRFAEKPPTATSAARKPKFVSPLYTRPADVTALEARIVELEAREERDGWQYLTENTSSDSGLPSCRLNFMFQEGDSRERIEETASAFGIEVCWDVTDWDWQGPPEEMEELSADDLAKCAPRTDLTDAGWKLVDVWDTEDGEIVRMYARPISASLTREGVV